MQTYRVYVSQAGLVYYDIPALDADDAYERYILEEHAPTVVRMDTEVDQIVALED